MTIGGTVFVPTVSVAFLLATLTIVIFTYAFTDHRPLEPLVALLLGVVTACFAWLAKRSHQALHRGRIQAQILYVPPLTPDILPADEILVRGSEELPVAQSEVLLRAAQQGQETPKEELLRVTEAANNENNAGT
jgi:hypothetical protein